jgi:hypothetical protein
MNKMNKKKIDEMMNDQKMFARQIEKLIATIREELTKTAIIKNAEEKEKPLKEIAERMNRLLSLTAMHGTRNHKENILLYIETIYQETPDPQIARRTTLLKIRERLIYLLKDTYQDVEQESRLWYREENIVKLKSELKATGIPEELITEIMDEVYQTLRDLSGIIANYIRSKNEDEFMEASMGLGYLSLIPEITEEEIRDFLRADGLPDTLHEARVRYLLAIKRPAPIIKIGQEILGIYNGNPIIAKIKDITSHIVCDICSNRTSDIMEIKFDPVSLISVDHLGFLWQTISDIKWTDPNTIKPKADNDLIQYSERVIIKCKFEGKEYAGIGYYNFNEDNWTIATQRSSLCTNIPAKEVIAWLYIPTDIINKFKGYTL